jgi:hypothetical protein
VSPELAPIVAATTRWLVTAYPSSRDAFGAALAFVQARQAVTVASCLRYPTPTDAALVCLVGPGGSAYLDWFVGREHHEAGGDWAWRTWVDETVASWAACLLGDDRLAAAAAAALSRTHYGGCDFRRLLEPDERDRAAAVLLRHPDLLAPVADLHRRQLLERLLADPADVS